MYVRAPCCSFGLSLCSVCAANAFLGNDLSFLQLFRPCLSCKTADLESKNHNYGILEFPVFWLWFVAAAGWRTMLGFGLHLCKRISLLYVIATDLVDWKTRLFGPIYWIGLNCVVVVNFLLSWDQLAHPGRFHLLLVDWYLLVCCVYYSASRNIYIRYTTNFEIGLSIRQFLLLLALAWRAY